MKYLIVGLGNPGTEYDDTRHNVGFEILERLALRDKAEWKDGTLGWTTRVKHRGRTFVLLKPNTFMNLSGKAVRYWMQQEKVPQERLLVVVDDLNLDLGVLRLRGKGSDGGHNGLKHITQVLGNNKYARLRFGIGNDFGKGRQVQFVLGKWDDKDWETLPEALYRAGDAILSFGTIGLAHTMSKFNG